MVRLITGARSLGLWLLEIVLAGVWVSTLTAHWQAGNQTSALLAVVTLCLLWLLYYGEGIELAVSDLLDKQPEQLRDGSVREVLAEIQQRSGFFYAQRQVLVVVTISFMSLMTSYDAVYVLRPDGSGFVELTSWQTPFGLTVSLPFWFSLVFTTLTVLWFCQVVPKRLAVINSEAFLGHSTFIWPVIKTVGLLGLPGPSDHVVALMQKFTVYGRPRHLLPGPSAHYNVTTHLYGFSQDRCGVDVRMEGDGRARITRRVLALFVHGDRPQVGGLLATASCFLSPPRVTPLGLHTLPVPERFESIADSLDAIFEGRSPAPDSGVSADRLNEWVHTVEVLAAGPPDAAQGERRAWQIAGEPLPERFWSLSAAGEAVTTPLVALLYQIDEEVADGAFQMNGAENSWAEHVGFPCRRYTLSLETAPPTGRAIAVQRGDVKLDDPSVRLSGELERFQRQIISTPPDSHRRTVDISYPVQGATYRTYWRVFPSPADQAF